MSLRYLLDTNVLSEPLRPRPSSRVLARLAAHAAEIATCAPVWHELRHGAARLPRSAKRTAIEAYLDAVLGPRLPVLPYDAAAAAWHAQERARLAATGRTPAFVDGQVAAVACVNELVLVTANAAHFRPFRALRVESWV